MHNERVWNIKHGLVHQSFAAGPAARWTLNQHLTQQSTIKTKDSLSWNSVIDSMSALEPTAPCSQDVLIFVLNILTGNVLLFVYHIALRQAIITPTSEWCMMSLGLALWVTGTEGLGVTHMLYADDWPWQLMTRSNCRKCWDDWNRMSYSKCAEILHS